MDSPAGPVRVGFVSFTEVTSAGSHRDYNIWHELDHMPEQMPIPGIRFGRRWVCTPRCRAERAVETEPLGESHYFTLYLMADPIGPTLDRFSELARELHRLDRFYPHRLSHLSGPYRVLSAEAAPRVLVSPAAVPYRPGTGVYVVVESLDGAPDAVPDAPDPEPYLAADGVAGVWAFGPPDFDTGPFTSPPVRITTCFLDGDVHAAASSLGPVAAKAAIPGSTLLLAGAFETVTTGHWDWFDGA